jgi:dipeptidase E
LPPERRRPPTILAMGGGGFTAGPGDPALDELVLRLTDVARPRICLLPTAGGDSEHQIRRFYETYCDHLCSPSHISLFRLGRRPVPLREHLRAQDAIYVGGGSMVNLLAIWRAQGLDAILRDAWRSGVVLAGLSAGSMCWFQWGVSTGSGAPAPVRGLGFLRGSNSVHHDSEPARRPVYLEAVRTGAVPAGWAVDDGAALLFRGAVLADVVTARPGARAYAVNGHGGRPLPARPLAGSDRERPTAPAVAELRRLRAARLGVTRHG